MAFGIKGIKDGHKTLETPAELDREAKIELGKYFGYVFLVGCGIARAAQHYAYHTNCKLISSLMKLAESKEADSNSSSSEEKTE